MKYLKVFERLGYFVLALMSMIALSGICETLYFIYETLFEIADKL